MLFLLFISVLFQGRSTNDFFFCATLGVLLISSLESERQWLMGQKIRLKALILLIKDAIVLKSPDVYFRLIVGCPASKGRPNSSARLR